MRLLLVALALLLPSRAAFADSAPCSGAAIKIGTLLDGRILVPATIEGHKLWFLLDTGGMTTIKPQLAQQLGLPISPSDRALAGAGGSILNTNVTPENISLGDVVLKRHQIYIESRPLQIADGTLGADILREHDIEIDLANGELRLMGSDCPKLSANAIEIDVDQRGFIRFPVKLDGNTITALLDTGSAISVLRMDTASQLGIKPDGPPLSARGSGPYRTNVYQFQSLEFGGTSVKYPQIGGLSDNLLPVTNTALILGIDAFRYLHFLIAYGEKRIFILPERAEPGPPAGDQPVAAP